MKADQLLAILAPAEQPPIDVMAALEKMRERLPLEGHLSHLLAPPVIRVPWFASLRRNLLSVACHAAVLSFLVFGAANREVSTSIREHLTLIDPMLKPFAPETHKSGGGGGGAREQLPVSGGQLPKRSMRQFVPPQIVDHDPLLAMAPTIVAPPDAPLPQQLAANWGDPLAALSNGSNGRGTGGGMGDGDSKGPGYGPGANGAIGGGVFTVGGKVSNPIPIYKVDPEFSEEGRKARMSGSVTVAIIVDVNGRVRDAHVIKSLGLGLDEKAIEAVQQWKFKPGMKDGHPVNVIAQVLVTFHLL